MLITLSDETVNMSPGPAFMGHEEMAIPMFLARSTETLGGNTLCDLGHCLRPVFQPNDLSNTTALGYRAGMRRRGIDLDHMFACRRDDEWLQVSEIGEALDTLGREYAFFQEESPSPLTDGFVHRCRFIARDKLPDFCPGADLAAATHQTAPARNVLPAFLRAAWGDPDCRRHYGEYLRSGDFRRRFGDEEQFSLGYAIWLEEAGVLRAWTRVIYIPQ